MMNMAGNIGGALSPLIFGALAQFGSWAAPFIVAAGLLDDRGVGVQPEAQTTNPRRADPLPR